MYGPASTTSAPPSGGRGGGGGGAPPRERQFTPRGHMAGEANQRAPLLDLPPHLRMMFEPRPPLQYLPPISKKESQPYNGISHFLSLFETTPPPPREIFEAPAERKKRMQEQLMKLNEEKNQLMLSDWNPKNNPHATENAYQTLFVGRLSYDTSEKKLKREFEQYGTIKMIHLVTDHDSKSRGYAFIEFEKEQDMMDAYKRADGKKIDGRRIVVDVERGRTVPKWRPRRLGGGLGGRKAIKSKKTLAEEAKAAIAAAAAGSTTAASPAPSSTRGPPSSTSRPPDQSESRYRDSGRRDSRDRDRDRGGGGDINRYGPPPPSSSGGDYRDRRGIGFEPDRYDNGGYSRYGNTNGGSSSGGGTNGHPTGFVPSGGGGGYDSYRDNMRGGGGGGPPRSDSRDRNGGGYSRGSGAGDMYGSDSRRRARSPDRRDMERDYKRDRR